jgi:GDPmannose 4,6-dehydratase
MGLQDKVFLGNLDSKRDWGFAGDYVKMMWMMLQQDKPDDYVIATGKTMERPRVRELAFGHAGLDYKDFVAFDPRYLRPAEVDLLLGDPPRPSGSSAGCPPPASTSSSEMMVDHDLEMAKREKTLRDAGHKLGTSDYDHGH